MTDEDSAVEAGTGAQALKAAELRLYGVVVILSRWVRGLRGRLLLVHSFTSLTCGPGSEVSHHLRSHFLSSNPILPYCQMMSSSVQ